MKVSIVLFSFSLLSGFFVCAEAQSNATQAPNPAPVTNNTTPPEAFNEEAMCGCSCEVDADGSIQFGCRVLNIRDEIDTDAECAEYCKTAILPEGCDTYDRFHKFTCPAEYVFYIGCTCLNTEQTCQVSESYFGERSLTQADCSSRCARSIDFGVFCEIPDGGNFTSAFTVGNSETPTFETLETNTTGFGIPLCDSFAGTCNETSKTMEFTLEELNGSCICVCQAFNSSHNCRDVLRGMSYVNGQDKCNEYCKMKSPCAFFPYEYVKGFRMGTCEPPTSGTPRGPDALLISFVTAVPALTLFLRMIW